MSLKDLRDALNGPKGSIDAYLECVDESEFRADVLAFAQQANQDRRMFAAMAMQGMLANSRKGPHDWMVGGDLQRLAVEHADALIAELAKEKK